MSYVHGANLRVLQVNFITMQCFKKVQLYAGFDKYNLSIAK